MATEILQLQKGEHRFIITYETGCEKQVLDELAAKVKREHPLFDWIDAAILSHQMGNILAKELKEKGLPHAPRP